MGFIDRFTKRGSGLDAEALKAKATELAREHHSTIDSGIDKAAGLADKATKGRHGATVQKAATKAKGVVDDVSKDDGHGTGGRPTR